MECVREIRDERLHLAHRHFGLKDSDSGLQGGAALVGFANSEKIKTIKFDLVVRSVQESPCANPSFGGSANVWGTFFNAGSGDPNDDVGAQLVCGRLATDPPVQVKCARPDFPCRRLFPVFRPGFGCHRDAGNRNPELGSGTNLS